jgi:hypothetical protein
MKRLAVLIAVLFAGIASAQDTRPIARDDTAAADWFLVPPSIQATAQSRRPETRTPAVRAAAAEQAEALSQGAVCGDIALQGDRIGSHSGPRRCGVEDAVRLRSVLGITLSTPAIIDCTTARALRTWVDDGLLPAVGNEGGGVASIRVVAHYACRTRNNLPGARLSEHASGRAIDIAGIGLRDGQEITVLTGWNSIDDSQQLRRMWRAACGPFGTVLGPEANQLHHDHFHFDTARHRSGSYCR